MEAVSFVVFVLLLVVVVLLSIFLIGHIAPSLDPTLRSLVIAVVLLAFCLAWWHGDFHRLMP